MFILKGTSKNDSLSTLASLQADYENPSARAGFSPDAINGKSWGRGPKTDTSSIWANKYLFYNLCSSKSALSSFPVGKPNNVLNWSTSIFYSHSPSWWQSFSTSHYTFFFIHLPFWRCISTGNKSKITLYLLQLLQNISIWSYVWLHLAGKAIAGNGSASFFIRQQSFIYPSGWDIW